MTALAENQAATPPRLRSLDALRGFDMLWITGGRSLVVALAASTGWPIFKALEAQFHHAAWNGFTLWDLVFPLFLFLSGATLPFSQDRRLEQGVPRSKLAQKILRRAFVLVLLGAIYNGLLQFDWEHQRWASVLARIGLGWAGAALIALFVGVRGRTIAMAAILLGYGALFFLWPIAASAGAFDQGQNVADLFDQRFLPGRLHRGNHDPEGLLSTIPAIATALLGALAGERLRRAGKPRARTAFELMGGGLVLLLAGWCLGFVIPINKALWTPSFVLFAAGWSALLLGLFHLLIDLPGGTVADGIQPSRSQVWSARLSFPFVVLGSNAIALYLLDRFVAFEAITDFVFQHEPALLSPVALAIAALFLRWLCLYALWRRRLFLRV
ncbi:MAG: putative acyltransferase [Planctomycetota bacterium]|jgi:predicted acyltransferase